MRFRDAVWEAPLDALTTVERLVLLAYANHAYNGADTAWVVYRRLQQQCGIRSMSTVTRVLASLRKKGWLQLVNPTRQRTSSAQYRLTIPDPVAPMSGTAVAPMSGAVSGPAVAPMSERVAPMVDKSAPMSGADCTDGGHLLSGEESLKTLPAGLSPPGSAPAPPSDDENPAPVTAEAAKAAIRQALAGKRSAKLSRWADPRPVPANGSYDRATAARLAADAARTATADYDAEESQ